MGGAALRSGRDPGRPDQGATPPRVGFSFSPIWRRDPRCCLVSRPSQGARAWRSSAARRGAFNSLRSAQRRWKRYTRRPRRRLMRWGELSPFHHRTVGTPVTLEGHPGAENSPGRPHGQANCARVQFFRNFLQNPIGEECFLIRSLDRAVADTARNRQKERSRPKLAAECGFCAQADRSGPSLPGLEPGPYFAVIAANSRIAKFAGFRPCPRRVRSGIGSDMPT